MLTKNAYLLVVKNIKIVVTIIYVMKDIAFKLILKHLEEDIVMKIMNVTPSMYVKIIIVN